MVTMLKDWLGAVEYNGKTYDSVEAFLSDFKSDSDTIHIKLRTSAKNAKMSAQNVSESASKILKVTVKAYMTKPATPDFDFMAKWNDNKPMPLRTMIGTVEKETRGMVYMHLHGFAQKTITCACCGRELTNPESRYYGIGPICLEKIGIMRNITDIKNITEDLEKIEWSGWIIKSSILEREEVE